MKDNQIIQKGLLIGSMALALACTSMTTQAAPLDRFDVAGVTIDFDGNGNFSFNDEGGDNHNDFEIEAQWGGTGALVGLFGDIEGIFSFDDPAGSNIVTVTSPANAYFSIWDGVDLFKATIDIIRLVDTTFNIGGVFGYVELSGASYLGTNADLQSLATMSDLGTATITFQLNGQNLDDLYSSTYQSSWSGTIDVPEPGPLFLLGTSILGLGFLSRRRKIKLVRS